jgi:hypothetical protein
MTSVSSTSDNGETPLPYPLQINIYGDVVLNNKDDIKYLQNTRFKEVRIPGIYKNQDRSQKEVEDHLTYFTNQAYDARHITIMEMEAQRQQQDNTPITTADNSHPFVYHEIITPRLPNPTEPERTIGETSTPLAVALARLTTTLRSPQEPPHVIWLLGVAGTGKSYMVKKLLEIVHPILTTRIVVGSPHGLQAYILGEALTALCEVGTLHRLFSLRPHVNTKSETLKYRDTLLMVIDECGFLGGTLLKRILPALPKIRLIFMCGDLTQLHPVGDTKVDIHHPCFKRFRHTIINLHKQRRSGNEANQQFQATDYGREANTLLTYLYTSEKISKWGPIMTAEDHELFLRRLSYKALVESDLVYLNSRIIPYNKVFTKKFLCLLSKVNTYNFFETNIWKDRFNQQITLFSEEEIVINHIAKDKISKWQEAANRKKRLAAYRRGTPQHDSPDDPPSYAGKLPRVLTLKKGDRVTILFNNVAVHRQHVNGYIGYVHSFDSITKNINICERYAEVSMSSPPMFGVPLHDDNSNGITRRQYPLTLCYGMTIHKGQGITCTGLVFLHVGGDLGRPDATKLYVAASRVRDPQMFWIVDHNKAPQKFNIKSINGLCQKYNLNGVINPVLNNKPTSSMSLPARPKIITSADTTVARCKAAINSQVAAQKFRYDFQRNQQHQRYQRLLNTPTSSSSTSQQTSILRYVKKRPE